MRTIWPSTGMFLDAKIENGRRNVDHSKRQRRNTRHARATRNGDPDLGWKLRSDVMESKGRNQADDRPRDGGNGNRQVVVFQEFFKYKSKYPPRMLLPKLPAKMASFWASVFGDLLSKIADLVRRHHAEPLEIREPVFNVEALGG
jgi:hypothetical protein